MPWFQRRRAVAEQEQHKLWRQARMNTDIQQFISKRSELEIVDSFNAIERHFLEEIQVFFPLISCFLLGYAFIFSHFLRKHALTKNTYKSFFFILKHLRLSREHLIFKTVLTVSSES